MPLSRTCLAMPAYPHRRADGVPRAIGSPRPSGMLRRVLPCVLAAAAVSAATGALPAMAAGTAADSAGTAKAAKAERSAADTLELKSAQAQRPAPFPTDAAKTVIVPSDVDRQLGNLGDLLQRVAGLHVTRMGGMGDYMGVSIWGSSERQVNVYVNGVPRNQAGDPSRFLSGWDLSTVDRIEVYEGLAPDNLPGSPMGGAINIITRDQAQGPAAQVAVGAASFGTLTANGSVDYRRGAWSIRAQAARNASDGDFIYYDDNGLEFQPGRHPDGAARLGEGDLTRKTRRNNAHEYAELSGDLGFHPTPRLETGLQGSFSGLHKQIPSPDPGIAPDANVATFLENRQASLRGYGKWTDGNSEASFDLSAAYLADIYVDTSRAGGAVGLGYDNDRNAYTNALGTLWGRTRLGGLTLSALGSYGVSAYAYTNRILDRAYPQVFRYTGEGKLTPTYTLGRHTVQAVLAADLALEEHYADRFFTYGGYEVPREDWTHHGSLRLGYQYLWRPGAWLSAEAGNAYRIPSFLERFGDQGAILANPALRAESGLNGSVSVHAETKRYAGDAKVFANEGRRIITLVQNSQFVMVYRNTDETRVFGLQSGLSAAPRPWTRTRLDLTLMKAMNVTGGSGGSEYKLIPYKPRTQASLRQSFFLGRWTLEATGYYQGLAYPNPSNQASLFDSYSHNTEWQSRADLDLSWRASHLLAAAGIRNVFNQRLFDYFNYPLPGRSLSACIQAEY
jgi:iron complex outermembrane receptor protein